MDIKASIEITDKVLVTMGDIRPEPPHDGTVICFAIKHPNSNIIYRYAAIKARKKWFTTGASCPIRGWEWDTLNKWIQLHEVIQEITLMKEA